MGNIYTMPDGVATAVYEMGNGIYMQRLMTKGQGTTCMCKDYMRDICTVYFQGNVFWAYVNWDDELYIDSAYSEKMLLMKKCEKISNISMLVHNGEIVLIYTENKENESYIGIIQPFHKKTARIPVASDIPPIIYTDNKSVCIQTGTITYHVNCGNTHKDQITWEKVSLESNQELLDKIKRISAQYEELADYSRKLQEEARQMRDRAFIK